MSLAKEAVEAESVDEAVGLLVTPADPEGNRGFRTIVTKSEAKDVRRRSRSISEVGTRAKKIDVARSAPSAISAMVLYAR